MMHSDTEEVARLYQQNFHGEIKRLSTYGQRGLPNYLSDLLKSNSLFDTFRFYVYESDDGIGFAEFRIYTDKGFLSNIFVDQGLQGRGAGTQLIRHFLSEHPNITSLSLDVFESNPGALRLYERLGFEREFAQGWYVRRLDSAHSTELGTLEADGLLSRIAMYQRYGFTEYQVVGGPRVGRLGESVLRCTSPQDASEPKVLGALKRHFPEITEAFCISPEPLSHPWKQVDVSQRMTLFPERKFD